MPAASPSVPATTPCDPPWARTSATTSTSWPSTRRRVAAPAAGRPDDPQRAAVSSSPVAVVDSQTATTVHVTVERGADHCRAPRRSTSSSASRSTRGGRRPSGAVPGSAGRCSSTPSPTAGGSTPPPSRYVHDGRLDVTIDLDAPAHGRLGAADLRRGHRGLPGPRPLAGGPAPSASPAAAPTSPRPHRRRHLDRDVRRRRGGPRRAAEVAAALHLRGARASVPVAVLTGLVAGAVAAAVATPRGRPGRGRRHRPGAAGTPPALRAGDGGGRLRGRRRDLRGGPPGPALVPDNGAWPQSFGTASQWAWAGVVFLGADGAVDVALRARRRRLDRGDGGGADPTEPSTREGDGRPPISATDQPGQLS